MGRSIKPRYVVQIFEVRFVDGAPKAVRTIEGMAWETQQRGAPTEDNLREFLYAYGKSLETGGANAHLAEGLGYLPYPVRGAITFNEPGGEVVARYQFPTFFVW